jgi:hypothetical protein
MRIGPVELAILVCFGGIAVAVIGLVLLLVIKLAKK